MHQKRDELEQPDRWVNQRLALGFWSIVISALLITALGRVFIRLWGRQSAKIIPSKQRHPPFITLANGCVHRLGALVRGIYLISVPASARIPFPTLGQALYVGAYVALVIYLIMSVPTPRDSFSFSEDLGKRAAWITVTQVPLVYLLATKRGPINLLAGLSYERINWLHRWAGRILLISATTHMSCFVSEWSLDDIFRSKEKNMTFVRHGLGGYSLLCWIALTSILPLRRYGYRWFYINHVISVMSFACVIWGHVPPYARYNLYLVLFIILFDKFVCCFSLFRNNLSNASPGTKYTKISQVQANQDEVPQRSSPFGYAVELQPHEEALLAQMESEVLSQDTVTVLRVTMVPFTWNPGQHIRIYLPKLGPLEAHPFTPATCNWSNKTADCLDIEAGQKEASSPLTSEMVLFVRTHSGITRRIAQHYNVCVDRTTPSSLSSSSHITAIIDGPYGNTPAWSSYTNLILISASTGVSFTLSIMDHLARMASSRDTTTQHNLLTRKIHFIWVVRHIDLAFDAAVTAMLSRHVASLRRAGIEVESQIFTTCPQSAVKEESNTRVSLINPSTRKTTLEADGTHDEIPLQPLSLPSPTAFEISDASEPNDALDADLSTAESAHLLGTTPPPSHLPPACKACNYHRFRPSENSDPHITREYGVRPSLPSLLRSAAPANDPSSTMVGVCGGAPLLMETRNLVAKMNFGSALGRRKGDVRIFTEGFG